MRIREIKETLLRSNNKNLTNWIYENYDPTRSVGDSMNQLNTLKKLDDNTLIYAIARMEQIEAANSTKYLSVFIAILVVYFSISKRFFPIWLDFIVTLIVLGLLFIIWCKEKKSYLAAVYFKNLIKLVKDNKSESKRK